MKAAGLSKDLPIEDPGSLLDFEVPHPEAQGKALLGQVRP